MPPSLLNFLSGAVFSVVGIATVIASPFLGRMGDRMGYKRVLRTLVALLDKCETEFH